MFEGWWQLRERCDHCGLPIRRRESDTWAIMYISTALITGLFLLPMLWLAPTHRWLWRILIVLFALAVYLLTSLARKGFAIAFDYLIELRWNNEGQVAFIGRRSGK